jgi:pimeloyl-ACP methyl ester carboxylesterase
VSEIQVFLEIAALKELTHLVATGQVKGITADYADIIHIGHSFGSIITYNLVNNHPGISSGIVLTGFSQVAAYVSQFALGGNFAPVTENPTLAAKYPAGYVAPKSTICVHINFFAEGTFDPKILDAAAETGQPATPGEILTLGAGTSQPSCFKGPVLIITGGRFDLFTTHKTHC